MGKMVTTWTSIAFAVLLVAVLIVPPVSAADGSERDVAFYTDYTKFELAAGDEIEVSVSIDNQGDVAEDIDLSVDTPEGWEASLTAWATKTAQVRSVHAEPMQEAPMKLTLKSTVPKTSAAGEYTITLNAASRDLVIQESVDITAVVTEEGAGYTGPAAVDLTPDYTSLQGAPGSNVEFKVGVTNKSAEDTTFDFTTILPAYVDVTLSPTTDRSKKISSLRVEAGGTQTVIVTMSMGQDIATEPYTVTFTATSGDVSESVDLTVEVQGFGHLLAGTMRQGEPQEVLSYKTTAGKATIISLYVLNDGTGPIKNISFSAPIKPKDWSVEFEPGEVAYLPPAASIEDLREVNVKITPKSKAIAGDYRVQVRIRNPSGAAQTLDFRIQVETSGKWLWYALIIIVAVLAALLGVFLWLRRR